MQLFLEAVGTAADVQLERDPNIASVPPVDGTGMNPDLPDAGGRLLLVRRLALDPDPEVISRARAIMNMQESLHGDTTQMGLFNELDRAFHRTLFAGVGMTNLQQILIRRLGHLFRCQMLDLPSEGKMADIVEKHWRILHGIERGDPDEAMEAIRVHLSGTIRRLDMLRGQFPEFFSS